MRTFRSTSRTALKALCILAGACTFAHAGLAETTAHKVKLGFEEAELPAGWSASNAAGYSFQRDTEVKRTGEASARLSVQDGLAEYGYPHLAYRVADFTIPEGMTRDWELSFHCKTEMTEWEEDTCSEYRGGG